MQHMTSAQYIYWNFNSRGFVWLSHLTSHEQLRLLILELGQMQDYDEVSHCSFPRTPSTYNEWIHLNAVALSRLQNPVVYAIDIDIDIDTFYHAQNCNCN